MFIRIHSLVWLTSLLFPIVGHSISLTDRAEVISSEPITQTPNVRLSDKECLRRYTDYKIPLSLVNDIKVQRCYDGFEHDHKKIITGYRVVWRYGEITGVKIIRHAPGKSIPVEVNFKPVSLH